MATGNVNIWGLAALKFVREEAIQLAVDIPDNLTAMTRDEALQWLSRNVVAVHAGAGGIEATAESRMIRIVRDAEQSFIKLDMPPPLIEWKVRSQVLGSFREPPVAGALNIDGSWSSRREDVQFLNNQGPAWKLNSCAVDVVCALFARLKAGIVEYDQLPLEWLQLRSRTSQLFHAYVQNRWGSACTDFLTVRNTMGDLRDIIRQEVVNDTNCVIKDTAQHVGMSSELAVGFILERALMDLPQVEYFGVHGDWCQGCGSVVEGSLKRPGSKGLLQRFDLSAETMRRENTIQLELNRYLAPQDRREARVHGSDKSCGICKTDADIVTGILTAEELPPRIVFCCPLDAARPGRLEYEPFSVTYYSADANGGVQERLKQYHPIGMIFLDQRKRHYTMWWRLKYEWSEYDGMKRHGRWSDAISQGAMVEQIAPSGASYNEKDGCPAVIFEQTYYIKQP